MGLLVIDPNITKSMFRFGQTIRYYPGSLCSCVGANNGVPLPNHTCNQGFNYGTAQILSGIRTAISYKTLATPQGRIYSGGATFTIPQYDLNGSLQNAYSTIAHGDILVLDNKVRRDTDVLQRGSRDVIYAFDVTEILSITQNNNAFIQGVDFDAISYDASYNILTETEFKLLTENLNFVSQEIGGDTLPIVGSLTIIIWKNGGNAPATDSYYSVEFISKQQYKVWEDGGQDRGTDTDFLPKKVLCVLRRFINVSDNPADYIDVNQSLY